MKQKIKKHVEQTWLTLLATRPMWGMAFLRVIFGLVLILEGLSRYRFLRHEPASLISEIPGDVAFAIIVAFSLIEIIAGIMAILGIGMRGVGAVIMFEMFLSVFFERVPLSFDRSFTTQILLIAIAVKAFFSGAGRFSLDRVIAKKLLKKHPSVKKELYMIAETPYTKWWE